MNCNNTVYRSGNYRANSCLKNLSLKSQAELVMHDVLAVNRMRGKFNLDPRVSACMAYRESHFSPNAKGGTPDWGMFQVISSTARSVLRRHSPVTQGFVGYRYNWDLYRQKMLQSTLAQADLHHAVLLSKAEDNKMLSQLNSSPESSSLYQKLAARYNGGGSRAAHYGYRIRQCYDAMKQIADRNGNVRDSSKLKRALDRALN